MEIFYMDEEMVWVWKYFPMANFILVILKKIYLQIKDFISGINDNTFLENLNLAKKYGEDWKGRSNIKELLKIIKEVDSVLVGMQAVKYILGNGLMVKNMGKVIFLNLMVQSLLGIG
jgi:hypothetical protein